MRRAALRLTVADDPELWAGHPQLTSRVYRGPGLGPLWVEVGIV